MILTRKYAIIYFSLSGFLFFYSCAAIQAPPGGPKDIIPPELVHAVPADGSIYFAGGQVELVFSEYLLESSVEISIRIQPSLPEPPEIKYRGRTLWINFPDSLAENQTYIISISRDLRDEHNVQLGQGLQIAYATGAEIDQGKISGKIYYENDQPNEAQVTLANIEKAKEYLNWQPRISFDEGVGKTIANLWGRRNDNKSNATNEKKN